MSLVLPSRSAVSVQERGNICRLGSRVGPLAAAAASVGEERRVRQSSSPTGHGEEHGAWRCNHVGGCLLELP